MQLLKKTTVAVYLDIYNVLKPCAQLVIGKCIAKSLYRQFARKRLHNLSGL